MSQLNPAFRTVMRGYEPTEVDKALSDLRKALDQARADGASQASTVATLQAQVTQLTDDLAAQRAKVSQLQSQPAPAAAEPTFESFGARVGKILGLADQEAKDLLATAKSSAESLTKDTEASAELTRTSADTYAAETRNKADADAARIVEAARQQADEIIDYADREATTRREEAEAVYEHQLARAAAAAADFETTLADRRQKSADEFTAVMGAQEQALASAQERHAAVEAEAERAKAEAKAQVEALMKTAREEAAQHVDSARQAADKIRRETDRELQAATSRRDAITAQLTNVRQMLATLSGTTITNPFGEPDVPAAVAQTVVADEADEPEEVDEELEDEDLDETDGDEDYDDEAEDETDEVEAAEGEKANA